ncbi:NTP transferase domain-containing protein [Photobacterium swingsii]|uniref:phosphocholine cytidylyltransferase family protein n=1 Tax=Photobacterium swingsii TaxID=680026 RepID=UPI00352FE2FC
MTKALILAAGQGTRLRPITDNMPKCLVPLKGISMLERQVDTMKSCGVENIHIATGYCSEQIVEMGFETSFNKDFDKTNMVESLFSAVDFMTGDQDLIISYGDIVYQKNNLEALIECNDEISLMIDSSWKDLWSLRLDNPLDDAETLKLTKTGYITELGKKPKSYSEIEGQYTGLIKIRADKINDFIEFYRALDRSSIYDGNDFYNLYMTSFLQLLIDSGWKAKAVKVTNGWLEIDSVSDLELYERKIDDGSLVDLYDMDK